MRTLIVIVVSQSLIFSPFLHAADLVLSSGDIIAPKIEHSPINTKAQIGETVKFTAKITDSSGIKEAILFYREIGGTQFTRIEMANEMGTDNYSISLPNIQSPGIEYYIQATDMAGNSLLRGHSFDPLKVEVATTPKPSESEDAAAPTKSAADKKKSSVNWVWVAPGALAVGAVAAVAGGGGGGGSGGDDTTTTVPVTVNAPIPQ